VALHDSGAVLQKGGILSEAVSEAACKRSLYPGFLIHATSNPEEVDMVTWLPVVVWLLLGSPLIG
jgi:hypothetical protein